MAMSPKRSERYTDGDLRSARSAVVRILDALERGDLDAVTPSERRLQRRLEGAVSGIDAALGETHSPETLGDPDDA